MNLAFAPLFQRLARARRIMVAGCGGGYDVFCGLPLYLHLRPRAEAVFLGNLSFASLEAGMGRRLAPGLTEIDADTMGSDEYFPERSLCRWLRRQGVETSVYCFSRTGVKTLARGWRRLVKDLGLDAIVLADGGTDSLMRGDEAGLGTPQEDLAHLAAVASLDVGCKVLSCLGFGVDTFDGVCHAHFLEAVAALQRERAFLGAFSLLPEMPEARAFLEAVDFAGQEFPGSPSVVSNSVASAVEGHFGDHHRTWRTTGNQLFISPLMAMYWSFELEAVARRCLYRKPLLQTSSYADVERVVNEFRGSHPGRDWQPIPY